MIGRTGFVGDLLYSVWLFPASSTRSSATGPGVRMAGWQPWEARETFFPSLGTSFHDFAGSTVVHTIGGFIALAGAIVLGPRLGRKFKRDGGRPCFRTI